MGIAFRVYQIGRKIPLNFEYKSLDKKLKLVMFPYNAKEVILSSAFIFFASLILAYLLSLLSPFLYWSVLFLGIVFAIFIYIFPSKIFYTQTIMEYKEEMLRSILHVSTYIQTGSSMESAFIHTENAIHGVLKQQFTDINNKLRRKIKVTLGDAINEYAGIWNEVNPQFVKGIRLLQLAALSSENDKDRLINETIETLMVSYTILGKRSAENLSKNTKMLIGAGLMLPIMSLLALPILAIFMPQYVQPPVIAFLYIILFPTVILIAAMTFASERVQVDTIRITDSIKYKPFPSIYIYIAIGIATLAAVPTIMTLTAVFTNPDLVPDSILSFFYVWLFSGGVMLAIYLVASIYVRRYEKMWNEISEIEGDLPFMLQSFSTYFTLNTPFEKVIDGVIDDYQNLGFGKHPTVKAFKSIKRMLYSTKMTIHEIVDKHIRSLIPSSKVRSVLQQVSAYESVSQESAAKASRMVRQQVLNTYKLDDYIKTLLSDTLSFIKTGISMLAPLLGAAAVVMTYAILKSTMFITQQLESISEIFGGQKIELNLVDMSHVVSPLFIAFVVSIYVLEMIIVLSVFHTQINTGTDAFKMMKDLKGNILSFLLFSILVFVGYIFVNNVLFKTVMTMG